MTINDIFFQFLFLCLASTSLLVNAGITLNPRIHLVKRDQTPVNDDFTKHDPPLLWTALGDSYTAAPGAGDDYEDDNNPCWRKTGSYAVQIDNDFPFNGAQQMQFIACTAYKTTDTLANTMPLITQDTRDFMVMSLGGNDIGFGDLAKACLVGIKGDCDAQITDSRTKIASQDFYNNLFAVYNAIFNKMTKNYHYQLYHILYHRFFYINPSSNNEWCNTQSLGLIYKPQLTKELRQTLNDLSDQLNARIEEIAQAFTKSKMGGPVGNGYKFPEPGWETGIQRLITINPDKQHDDIRNVDYGLFDGHRFCETGVEDPDFYDSSIWFFSGLLAGDVPASGTAQSTTMGGPSAFSQFDTKTCATDPRYESDVVFSYQCDIAIYFASPNSNQTIKIATAPEGFTKPYHPRTAGHTAIKRLLYAILQKKRPSLSSLCAAENVQDVPEISVEVQAATDGVQASTTCTPNIVGLSTSTSPTGTGTGTTPGTVTATGAKSSSTLSEWNGPDGKVPANKFLFSVLPARAQPSPIILKSRRGLGGREKLANRDVIPPPPPTTGAPYNATLSIYAQSGSSSDQSVWGPFLIDCTQSQSAWQLFTASDIREKYSMTIQSGHACANVTSQDNWDNLHIKYSNQYVDVPDNLKANGNCTELNSGVLCSLLLD